MWPDAPPVRRTRLGTAEACFSRTLNSDDVWHTVLVLFVACDSVLGKQVDLSSRSSFMIDLFALLSGKLCATGTVRLAESPPRLE